MMKLSALDKLFPAPKDGKDGNAAVVFRIVCSNTTPNVTDSAAVITLTAMKITGSKREKATLSSSLYFTDGTNNYISNPLTVTIAKGAKTSKTFLLKDSTLADPLDEVSISPVVNGENGTSILAQYCPSEMTLNIGAKPTPDETNVHNTYMSGDEWMRTKSSADTNYGSWFRIVGEDGQDGEYTDYTFNLSKDKTNKDAYTSPGNLKSTSWTDAPQVPDKTYPYLWMRLQRKNLPADTAVMSGHEYTYVRLTGEDGKTVTAQYSVDGKTNWHSQFATGDIWMRTSEDGGNTWGAAVRIVGEKGIDGSWTDYRFNISSALTTSSSETAPSPLGRSNWEDAPMATTKTFPYLWMKVQRYSDANTKEGNATYARLTGEKGPQGQTGGVGPMMYYAGEWQQGVAYVRTSQVVPLVSHGDDQFFYYPAKEGSLLNSEPSSTNTSWKQQQKVPLLLAQLLMVDFGKIASAVFCGDYMLSQYGKKKDGTVVNESSTEKDKAYKDFDASNPDGGGFVPNLWINFLTGKIRSVGGIFEDIRATGFLYPTPFVIDDSNFEQYFHEMKIEQSSSPLTILRKGYVTYKATGVKEIYLPGIGRAQLTDEVKVELRSLVGNIVRIYNKGTGVLSFTGDTVSQDTSRWEFDTKSNIFKRNYTLSYTSSQVKPGQFVVFRCIADRDENKKEVIYWEYLIGEL